MQELDLSVKNYKLIDCILERVNSLYEMRNRIVIIYIFSEIENLINSNKHNSKPMLICTRNKKSEKELLERLSKTSFFNLLYIRVSINKKDYVCKVRLKDFLLRYDDGYLKDKLTSGRFTRLERITWLSEEQKRKICVIGGQCYSCLEKDDCLYIAEINKRKEKSNKDLKIELLVAGQVTNKILKDTRFVEDYSKVIFYKMKIDALTTSLSKNEMLEIIYELRPKKLNTNYKIKLNRYCNKCNKLIDLFFVDRSISIRSELLTELEKLLEALNTEKSYKLVIITNKLRYFDENNITDILESENDITIKFKLNI